MIIGTIILIIFVISLGGILFILAHKIPALVGLPQNGKSGISGSWLVSGLEDIIKKFVEPFQKQIFLHKILSWIKVVILKIETRIDNLLHKIRKDAQKK